MKARAVVPYEQRTVHYVVPSTAPLRHTRCGLTANRVRYTAILLDITCQKCKMSDEGREKR